jgi:hypothetical protein
LKKLHQQQHIALLVCPFAALTNLIEWKVALFLVGMPARSSSFWTLSLILRGSRFRRQQYMAAYLSRAQVVASKQQFERAEEYETMWQAVRKGDIIGLYVVPWVVGLTQRPEVRGVPGRTKTGEPSLYANSV